MSNLKYSFTFLAVIIVIIGVRFGYGELRFCLNGPQKMSDEDCPGGFVFTEEAKPTCKFYAKTGNHSGIVLSGPLDVCDETTARAIENEGDDLADMESLTWFSWEEYEANETMGLFPEKMCEDDCLADWEGDDIYPDEDPIPEDWDPSSISAELQEKFVTMNKGMFMRIVFDEDYEKDIIKGSLPPMPRGVPPLPPLPEIVDKVSTNMEKGENSLITTAPKDSSKLYIIKLLARSFKVAISVCAPFVREEFYEQILKGMIFITKTYESTILDVGADLYKGIARVLDHCALKHQQEFILNGTRCEGKEQVDGIYYPRTKRYWPHRLTGRSFRWGTFHPVIDAAWTTIDFIQSFCYDSFMKNMMLSHVFHAAVEQLFPVEVQLLWRFNPPVKNEQFWNNILQTYDLNMTMRNLDACAMAARNSSPFTAPLPRPFYTLTDLEKPSPGPKPPVPVKGWNKTIEKYWEYYEKQGGFQTASNKFGKCFQDFHSEEQNDMLDNLKKSCT